MFEKSDRVVLFNHKLGKLKLHTCVAPNAKYRVNLTPSAVNGGILNLSTRGGGRAWHEYEPARAELAFWEAIRQFLVMRKCMDTLYINTDELKTLPARFANLSA